MQRTTKAQYADYIYNMVEYHKYKDLDSTASDSAYPELDFLKRFGSRAVVKIPDEKQKKGEKQLFPQVGRSIQVPPGRPPQKRRIAILSKFINLECLFKKY